MIELKFNILKLSNTDIEGIESDFLSIISETCFFLPVQLIVNETNVFFTKNNESNQIMDWLLLPAFSILTDWNEALLQLSEGKKIKLFLADAGQLNLYLHQGRVNVSTNFNDIVIYVDYDPFFKGLIKGIKQLKDQLMLKYPEVFEREELSFLL